MSARDGYLLFILFLCTVVLGPLGVLVLVVRPFDGRGRIGFGYARLWGWMLARLNPWWRVQVEGREHIQKGVGYVVVATHQNTLDIPLLYCLSGTPFRWVAKHELTRWPIVGWVLWLQRGIFVRRGDAQSAKRMMDKGVEQLGHGVSVAMFPEGTRSKTGRIEKFLPGAFLLAAKADAPLLPVVIGGDYEPSTGKRPMKGLFVVKVLPVVSTQEQRQMGIKGTMNTLEEVMRAEHKKISPEWYHE